MNDSFIARTIKTSLIVGGVLFVLLSQRVSLQVLWGGATGVLLSALNLFILSLFVKTIYKKRGLFYAVLKFPLFYGLLVFLLYQFQFSVYAFMAGFSVPLFVILLKTVGQAYQSNFNGGLSVVE